MGSQAIDYDALAKLSGGTPRAASAIDYDTLAAQHGGKAHGPNAAVASYQLSPTDLANKVLQSEGLPGVHRPDAEVAGRFAASPDNPLNKADGSGVGAQALAAVVRTGDVAHSMLEGDPKMVAMRYPDGSIRPTPAYGPTTPSLGKAAGVIAAPFQQAKQAGTELREGDYGAGAVDAAAALIGGKMLGKGAVEANETLPEAVRPTELAQQVGTAAKGVAAKVLPSMIDGPPEDLMTRAVKPGKNNVGWSNDVKSALPDMKAAEQVTGPINGVDDALSAAKAAKQELWRQYQEKLGPHAQATLDGNKVADAMTASIDKRTALQNPALADKVAAVADTYRRPVPLDEAEDFLQSVNRDLATYYVKNKVGRQAALGDPEKAYTVAEGDALRGALYDKLDELGETGAADLKQRYGALSNVEKELWGRKLVAERQQPQSLSEQLSTARGYGRVAKGLLTLDLGDVAEGAQTIAAAKWLKERQSTDALISRAFEATKPSATAARAVMPTPAGLLGAGATELGPSPLNATPPSQPPPVDATTRAVRKGLLLPEHTEAIPLGAPSPESTPMSVKPNYTIARDPKTGQMRKVYLSSGGGELIRDSGGTAPAGPGASRFLPIRTMSDGSSIVRDTLTGRILKLPPK